MTDNTSTNEDVSDEVITVTINGVVKSTTVRDHAKYLDEVHASRLANYSEVARAAAIQQQKDELRDNIASFWNDGLTAYEKRQVEQFIPTANTKIPVFVGGLRDDHQLYLYKLSSFPKKFGVDTCTILAAYLAKYTISTIGIHLYIQRDKHSYHIGKMVRVKKTRSKTVINKKSKKFFK